MEVMIAVTIFAASAILLSQLAGIGREHSRKADQAATAQQLANNKLNELLAGIEMLEAIEDEPFLDHPEWTYSIMVTPLEAMPQLSEVVVAVQPVPIADRERKTDMSASGGSIHAAYQIVRWMPSPADDTHEFDFGF